MINTGHSYWAWLDSTIQGAIHYGAAVAINKKAEALELYLFEQH